MRIRQHGFTLLELMMVTAIIGILAAIAVPSYQGYIYRAKAAEIVLVLDKIRTALSSLEADTGMNMGTQLLVYSDSVGVTYRPFNMSSSSKAIPGINANDLDLKHLGTDRDLMMLIFATVPRRCIGPTEHLFTGPAAENIENRRW